ncbi:hypothetical protein [Fulvivirga sedimenti]|uniref:Uncharacterized protein n=1 Tax=Fulvivirga sedimenti TaxID=2879465 RepID=A0A9X1KUT0_9BACT|nr:hypothetical protein [Fulvivirga sedimenti]MCA6073878.1 hypothetical protein [Fulvivirga sedimenti]
MKKLNYLFSLIVLISFLGFISCGGDGGNDPTIAEQQLANIVGTWATTTSSDVKLNNNDAPGDWSNFSITFTQQKGVSVAGAPTSEVDIFAISSYETQGSSATSFTVVFNNDVNETATVNINGSNMTMSFTLDEGDKLGAKVLSVEGTWNFSLVKQ